MSESAPSENLKPLEGQSGLPGIAPDIVEQDQPDELDNIVPTRGYQMLPVVGLGGSAGSIPALQRFFHAMPPDSGMAFVVILHLASEHGSVMDEILGRSTSMPVLQAKDGQRVEPNTVYVIPPGKLLTERDGSLRLTAIEQDRGKRVAVDLFFRTLADTHGPHASAIILSGADGDGALGIKRIKERGGLTVAQDPDEAEHPSMPRSAIDTGMVDWVLPVAEMPARLVKYRENAKRLQLPSEDGPQPAAVQPTSPDADENAMREVLSHLRTRTGRDFSYYKRATVVRRISRRMQVNGMATMGEYLGFMRTHPGEAGALQQDLLISVTNFYRDRAAFEALESYLPALFKGKCTSDVIRVWSAGCATGEEAYSIAMLLLEKAGTMDAPPSIQVFATDLDEDVIATAREGLYPFTIAADVSEDRLRRFFAKEHRGYRARRELRECVLFAVHDLLKDAPFSRLDLFICRNLLIYLNNDAQSRVFQTAHFALKPEGWLFIGCSEVVDEESKLFTLVDKRFRIYRQRPAARAGLPVPVGPSTIERAVHAQERAKTGPYIHGPAFSRLSVSALERDAAEHDGRRISWEELHFKLIERFAPPSLIVTRDYDILHVSENAGRFLHFSGGEPTVNLLKVVHPLLRVELRAALFRAAQTSAPVEVFRIPVDLEGAPVMVDIRVAPAQEIAPDYLLVVFTVRENVDPSIVQAAEETEPVVRHLEREIEQMKTRLRDTVEQYEASSEELKASNEELQAMNEELRSSAEELETSREELQSVNEELTTVNSELKSKVDDLGHANADLNNLMAATGVATIFLDRGLRITRYTPTAVTLFRLIPSDLGRPLTDITHGLNYPQLEEDAENVLETLVPLKRDVSDGERWFLAQLLPYRTQEDRIAGVVLSFVDITQAREASHELLVLQERLRLILESAKDYAIFTLDLERRVEIWNAGAEAILGYTQAEIRGKLGDILFVPEDREKGDPAAEAEIALRDGRAENERWHLRKDGLRIYGSGLSMPLRDGGKVIGFVKIMRDLTEQMHAREAVRDADERLRFAAEAANIYAWEVDLDSLRYTFASGTEKVLGFQLPESVAETIPLIHPDDRAMVSDKYERALKEHARFDAEFRFIHPGTGEIVWQSSHGVFLERAQGGPRFVGITQVTTDRKAAEEALRATEEQFRRALEEAPIPVIMYAEDGQVLQISRECTELTGYKPEDIPRLEAWLDRAHGPGVERIREQLQRLFEAGARLQETEVDITTARGEVRRWMFNASAPGKLRDGRRFMVAMAVDITERKLAEEALRESQERLRLILENATEYAIFTTDLERRITSWYPGAERLLGYSAEEIVGQMADVIFTPDDVGRNSAALEAEIALRDGRAADERWHRRKDGTLFWGSGVMTALRDPIGKAIGFLKIFRDQTAQRKAQEALEKSQAELWDALKENEKAREAAETARKAKDHFLAVLSHELRTPLTPVIMAVRTLARQKDLSPMIAEALEMIDRNIHLEARFIDDLLDVTRIERGKLELDRQPIELHDIVRHSVEVSASDIEEKKQEFRMALDATQCSLQGDVVRLQQVFWNLLKNASKFTPEGGRIEVRSWNEAGRINVSVTDSGMGFSPELADRLFDAFHQADVNVTRRFGGLGLGLAIAKATVEGHGGSLYAQSAGPSQGAIFTVSLPLDTTAAAEPASMEESPERPLRKRPSKPRGSKSPK